MYQEIEPSEGLTNVIDSFWTFSTNQVCESFKVLPDSCIDLIFDLNQNKGFVSGIMSSFQMVELEKESDLIGVRFKTEQFGSLSKVPLYETKNLRAELSHILPICEQNILSGLNDLEQVEDKISFLESYIETLFKNNYQKQDALVLSVTQKIRSLKGNININEIATSNNISLRQLERRFKSYIGLTIKEFSSVVRFKNAKELINSFTETSLLVIAFDSGFFDHSHMNHEFNRISGENPSFFR